MDKKELLGAIARALAVIAIVALLMNPAVLFTFGWLIAKVMLIALLATIVSRIVFKKSLTEIITDLWNRD